MNKDNLGKIYFILFKNLIEPSKSENQYTNYIYSAMNEVLIEDKELYEQGVEMLLDFERRYQMDVSVAEKQVFARQMGLTNRIMARPANREPKLSKQEKLPQKRSKYEMFDWIEIEGELVTLKHNIYNLCKKFFDKHKISMESLMFSPIE